MKYFFYILIVVFTLMTCQKVSEENSNALIGKWYFYVEINNKNGLDRTSNYHGEIYKLSKSYLIQYGISTFKKVNIKNNVIYDLSNRIIGDIDTNNCEFQFKENDYTVTVLGQR